MKLAHGLGPLLSTLLQLVQDPGSILIVREQMDI
jgi:hypothetical protein